MKKSELVLGNLVKGYKEEEEFVITSFNEDVVVLNNKKEVKVSTFLKNYKLIKAAENKVEVELPTFQLKLMAPMVAGLLPSGKKEKVKEVIYGIKVSKGINQTLIWKVLKKVYENKDEEGTKITKELKNQYPEVFENAVKCLVSKKRINYINSIC